MVLVDWIISKKGFGSVKDWRCPELNRRLLSEERPISTGVLLSR